MRSHGLREDTLQYVFSVKILPKLTYCSPAWLGFVNRSIITQLEYFLKRAIKCKYYSEDKPDLQTLIRNQEANLFKAVANNPAHCLYPLLPPLQSLPHNLRPRGHNFTLPSKDCRNFINRCLYEFK